MGLGDTFALPVVAGAPIALLRYGVSSPAATALLVVTLFTLDQLLDRWTQLRESNLTLTLTLIPKP